MGTTSANFRDYWNISFSKDRFIQFARRVLMVLWNAFKIFVGTLLGPVAFLRFNDFIKDCTSLGTVGVRKIIFWRGLSRKSEYFFICLYNFALYFFSNCGKELVKVITYYKWISYMLIIYMKTVYVFFLFFVYVYNRLDSIPNFKHILFVVMKIFLIMNSFANFSEFVL